MDEYKKFLADRLLSDEQPVTYRLLSRALDIHVNTAKEMLFDYHTYQNGIKANSIHATYLIYGTKVEADSNEDGDVEMGSCQHEHEPLSDEVVTITLTLARQEDLEATLAEYQNVTSIHIYSLAPHPQKNLSLLSDVTKSLLEYSSKEDPLKAAEKYGAISNSHVRRRDRKNGARAVASATTPSAKAQKAPAIKSEPAAAKKPEPALAKVKEEPSKEKPKSTATPASSAGKSTTPALKRGGSGSIMQSFAKAASKPPKPKPEPKKEEDSAMALSDDGEADDDDIISSKKVEKESEAARKSKKEREDELRRMMEEDFADEETKEEEDEPADEEMEEAPEPEPEPELETTAKEDTEPAEVVSSTNNGRRRGKRRVMTKERVMDSDGFLVTVQKPGWESFSEDEAPLPAKKQAKASASSTPSSTPASSGTKAKKPAGKGGQGNIMSFFSKK